MMLAVGEEEMVGMVLVFGFVLAIISLALWSKHKQARFKLIEKALESTSLDEESRKQLLDGLTSSGWVALLQQQFTFLARNAIFVVGWLGIFTGIGMASWGGANDTEELLGIGLLVGFVSLGLVTIPMALRELQTRRRA